MGTPREGTVAFQTQTQNRSVLAMKFPKFRNLGTTLILKKTLSE